MAPLAPVRVLTERLELRMFTAADFDAYARMSADPEVTRYLGTGEPQSPDIAWRVLASFLGHWQLLGYGQWAVTLRSDGTLVGRAGFFNPHGWPGFELGYMLAREHWGRGYAREAAAAALRIAFDDMRKERVISLIREQNAASIKLATSLGAQLEETIDFMGGQAQVYRYPPPR